MTDDIKELLELAAKACGMEVWFPRMNGGKNKDGSRIILEPCHTKNCFGEIVEWRPDLNDGDGARMETQLNLDIKRYADRVVVCSQDIWRVVEFYADHNGDRQAARRMASLRVAAEVGRRMQK